MINSALAILKPSIKATIKLKHCKNGISSNTIAVVFTDSCNYNSMVGNTIIKHKSPMKQ